MSYLWLYLGGGAAAYLVTRWLFRKAGVDLAGFHLAWTWGSIRSGEPLGFVCAVVLWPLSLLAVLLWWLGELQHLREKQRVAREKAAESWYANLTTAELMARQNEVMKGIDSARKEDGNSTPP